VTGETDVLFMAAQNPGAFTQFALPIPAAAYARSELDVTPPSVLAGRSGAYFLPNCASFKVEWTFADPVLDDLPQTLWVDPANTVLVTGDAHNPGQLQRMAQQYFPDPDDPKRHYLEGGLPEYLPNRIVGSFDTGDLGPMHYWSPAGVEPAKDAFYPTALRITVDAFDEAGRFERPIRHVMVIPVGS
jgi:hypothetical protein